MKRLLCIVGAMNAGGAETFLMKIYRNLDKKHYQMDFAVADEKPGVYDKEIYQLGGEIHHITPKTKGAIKSFKSIKKVVSENQYDYVMRISQHSLSGVELIAAKCGGAKKVIFRSSNTQTCGSKLNQQLHKVFLPITKYVPDVKLAPSTEAAEFMFGKGCIEKKGVNILPNALVIEDFKFSKDVRDEYRHDLHLEDKFVVGHVGRFSQQKNHDFLIDVFYEITKKRNDAVLVLVGTGELEERIKEKVKDLGIADKVQFLGVRSDVNKLLNVMDVFLFPSFFEGMPNTVVEAQTNGLPCVVADTITEEIKITDLVDMLPLSETAEQWANKLLKLTKIYQNDNRSKYTEIMIQHGYDIKDCVQKFITQIFE